jgi:hypothetical protein
MKFKVSGDEYIIPRNEWYVREKNLDMCVIKFMHAPGR